MKLSLRHMLLCILSGCVLFISVGVRAQIIIKSPAVHKTAASKSFVRPADPGMILKSADPSRNPQFAQRLYGSHASSANKAISATVSASKFLSPFDRVIKPIAEKLFKKAQLSSGLLKGGKADDVKITPGLAVNFPGFKGTPFVSTTPSGDPSPVVASLSMDVNQDGKMDLVTVQNDGTVNVLLASNAFSALTVTSRNQPQLLNDVYYIFAAQADMNKDGYPDLVVTDEQDNAAFVYINAKNGTFLPPVEYDFTFSSGAGFGTAGGGIGIGDINGDGYPDLVGVAFAPDGTAITTTVSIVGMLNNGDGTFGAALPEQTTALSGYINSGIGQVLLTDMNKDGKLDLILPASGYDQNFNQLIGISVLLGNGNGTFAPFPTSFPAAPASLASHYDDSVASFATADLNGDGNPDLIFSLGYQTVYVALGNGDGTLQDPTVVVSNDGTDIYGGASLVQYADVNGDGNIDIIGYDNGFFAIYLGQGGGVFAQTPLVQLVSGARGLVQPLPADFTGDGKVDIVDVDQTTGSAGLFPQSSGTFLGVPALSPPTETSQGFQTVLVGHVSGLGFPDIVAQDTGTATGVNNDYSPSIVAGVNDGKGNFTYSTLLSGTVIGNDDITYVVPVAADLNGDGRTDLVMESYTGLYVSLSNGDGTYAAPVSLNLGSNGAACGLSYSDIGDVNGDGYPDIIAAYAGDSSCGSTGPVPSGFFVLLNDGKGNFTSSFTPYGLAANLPKLVDLNGDGKLDLVLSDSSESEDEYYLYDIPGNGDGTFNVGASQYIMENSVVTSIIPGDFNGDGKQDLVIGVLTQVDGSGDVVYGTTGTETLAGNGDFTFQQPIQYTPGLFPIAGSYGDFNGDGRPDLALVLESYDAYTNVLSGNAATLVNLGGGAFAEGPAIFTAPNSSNGFAFTADFNADGAVDALFSPQILTGYVSPGLSELFLNNGGVAIALTSSAATTTQDSSVTLTATLTPTVSSQTPTGTVTFYNNGVSLGSVQVSSDMAAITLSTLPIGTDGITAAYSGDSNFNPATASTAVNVTVAALAPAFTLGAATPASLPIISGQSAIGTFTITSNATFSGNVTLACSGMPAETSCTISPASITLAGSQTMTLTAVVATTAKNNTYEAANRRMDWRKTVGGISCACLFLFLLPGKRRARRGALSLIVILGLGLSAMTSLTGCGGGGDKYPGTPTGTATLTVTATSGTFTQSTNFTITVSQ